LNHPKTLKTTMAGKCSTSYQTLISRVLSKASAGLAKAWVIFENNLHNQVLACLVRVLFGSLTVKSLRLSCA
jgi:hypothetical protein